MATIGRALERIATMQIIDDFSQLSRDRQRDVVIRTALAAAVALCIGLLFTPISPLFALCATPLFVVSVALMSFSMLTDPTRAAVERVTRAFQNLFGRAAG